MLGKGKTVHLGHHHVADDKVNSTRGEPLQCLFAIGSAEGCILLGEVRERKFFICKSSSTMSKVGRSDDFSFSVFRSAAARRLPL